MAKVEVTEARLEQVDLEVGPSPTVVVSVRLDGEIAGKLVRLARLDGRRMSDILREAVTSYAISHPAADSTWSVTTHGVRVDTTRSAVSTGREPQPEATVTWNQLQPAR